jgi:hypothetical protein
MQTTKFRASIAALALFVLAAAGGHVAAAPPSPADAVGKVTIGVAMPHAQLGQGSSGTDVGGPLLQTLVSYLHGPAVDVVALESRIPQQLDAEAVQKNCKYVLYSSVVHKHTTSLGGLLRAAAPFASALPALGAAGGAAGGNMAAAVVAQGAMSATAAAAQQQATAQMTGAQQTSIKSGDTVTLDYKLVAPGQSAPVKSETLQGKAKVDGEDVLSPLIEQLATSVVGAATGQAPAAPVAAPKPVDPAAGGAGAAAAGTAAVGASAGAGVSSLFGSRGSSAVTSKTASAAGASPSGMPPGMDCDKIAALPGAPMSVESCRKMQGAQQAYNTALVDPSASRPGDEQMSCDQIVAELKQQQYKTPDQAKVAEGRAASAELQTKLARQEAEVTAIVAKQTAEMEAATAADQAAAMATAGLARPQTAMAVQKQHDAENKATGERMAKERAPQEKILTTNTADLAGDAGQQLASNPRLARLVQLASAKNCKTR